MRFFKLVDLKTIAEYSELKDVDTNQVYLVAIYETHGGNIEIHGRSFEDYFRNRKVLAVFEADRKLYVISANENKITIHIFEDTSRLF